MKIDYSTRRKESLVKPALASFNIAVFDNRAQPHYRILYLELRLRPMSREHARPQLPGKGGGAARGPDGVARHRTEQHRGKVTAPGPHPAHLSSPVDPGGERWPKFRLLASLIAQLVYLRRFCNPHEGSERAHAIDSHKIPSIEAHGSLQIRTERGGVR